MIPFTRENLPDQFNETINLVDVVWNVTEENIENVCTEIENKLEKTCLSIIDIYKMVDQHASLNDRTYMANIRLLMKLLKINSN